MVIIEVPCTGIAVVGQHFANSLLGIALPVIRGSVATLLTLVLEATIQDFVLPHHQSEGG